MRRIGRSIADLRRDYALSAQSKISFVLYIVAAISTVVWAFLGDGDGTVLSSLRGHSHGAPNFYAMPAAEDGPIDACFVIVQSAEPNDFSAHSHVDAVRAQKNALEALGLIVSIDSFVGGAWTDPCAGAAHRILVGWPLLTTYPQQVIDSVPTDMVLWNFERIEPRSAWLEDDESRHAFIDRIPLHEVWESDAINIAPLLARLELDAEKVSHMAMGWVAPMTCSVAASDSGARRTTATSDSDSTPHTASVDVVIIGKLSERRQKIIHQLDHYGLSTTLIEDIFGEERDKVVRRSTVVVNVHREPHPGHAATSTDVADQAADALLSLREVERIIPMLAKGTFILSENNDRGANCPGLAWANFDDIARLALAWSLPEREEERNAITAQGLLLAVEGTSLYNRRAVALVAERWRSNHMVNNRTADEKVKPIVWCPVEVESARRTVEAWEKGRRSEAALSANKNTSALTLAASVDGDDDDAATEEATGFDAWSVAPSLPTNALLRAAPRLEAAVDLEKQQRVADNLSDSMEAVRATAAFEPVRVVAPAPSRETRQRHPIAEHAQMFSASDDAEEENRSDDIVKNMDAVSAIATSDPKHVAQTRQRHPIAEHAQMFSALDAEEDETVALVAAVSSRSAAVDDVDAVTRAATSYPSGAGTQAETRALLRGSRTVASTKKSEGPAVLPLGWEKGFAAGGKPYFYNRGTGETSWSAPG